MSFARTLIFQRASSGLVTVPVRHHTGYIPYEGRFPARDNPKRRLNMQCLVVNLQPCKKIHYTFDPFLSSVKGIREMMFILSAERIRKTNIKCLFKTEIVDDRREPTIKVELGGEHDGKSILFKTGRMDTFDILHQFNTMVLPLVKIEEEVVTASKGERMRRG